MVHVDSTIHVNFPVWFTHRLIIFKGIHVVNKKTAGIIIYFVLVILKLYNYYSKCQITLLHTPYL